MTELLCALEVPRFAHAEADILANARLGLPMAPANGKGKTVVIVGPGPSLRGAAIPDADEVWGCNMGLDYLVDHGQRVTHGIVIDADERMVTELPRTFDVTYRIASSVCPNFPAYLQAQGRAIEVFHSLVGIPNPEGQTPLGQWYEQTLYAAHYPPGLLANYGLNCGTRAVCLAFLMGFDHITAIGLDGACAPDGPPMIANDEPGYDAWLDQLVLYADGRSPRYQGQSPIMLEAVIDGRRWHTTVDYAMAAMCLVDMLHAFPDRLTVLGDTLPNAVRDKDAAFLAQMPRFVNGTHGAITGVEGFPTQFTVNEE